MAQNSVSAPFSFSAGLDRHVNESAELCEAVGALAKDVRATMAISTLAGEPIQHQRGVLTRENYRDFAPDEGQLSKAIDRAQELGLQVLKVGRFGVSVSGPAALIAELTGEPLVLQARHRPPPHDAAYRFAETYEPPEPDDLFVAPTTSLSVPVDFSAAVDHLVFTPPPLFFSPSATPPARNWHGVDQSDIRQILNVGTGLTGEGVKVAVIDSGFYPHPYYSSYKYRPTATNSAPNPHVDANGHGTAISFNVFAVAPDVSLLGFQSTDPPQDAIEDAADAEADIISCSWGWNSEQVFPIVQATLLDVIAEGRTVLFAAGNGHYAWPGSQPEVISVGGVYADANFALEASNYASGYMSSMFPGRRVPDVCGLCGQRPGAIYIMMPTQPGNSMDRGNAGSSHPQKDETAPDDGWVGASGTSSATPQVAGVVALMIQKARSSNKALSPGRIKQILEGSAVPITRGRNAMGMPASGHPSAATGWGLVDAAKAVAAV
jgi:serine protease AprX